jgi:hypothetical protein
MSKTSSSGESNSDESDDSLIPAKSGGHAHDDKTLDKGGFTFLKTFKTYFAVFEVTKVEFPETLDASDKQTSEERAEAADCDGGDVHQQHDGSASPTVVKHKATTKKKITDEMLEVCFE